MTYIIVLSIRDFKNKEQKLKNLTELKKKFLQKFFMYVSQFFQCFYDKHKLRKLKQFLKSEGSALTL